MKKKVVIVGGNDCMVCKYKNVCKEYNCKAKVFTQMKGTMKAQIGSPDLLILFTNTVSHKMIQCTLAEVKGNKDLEIKRAHSSSLSSLKGILNEYSDDYSFN